MAAKIEFFPVDNGDMTLITTESGRKILVDIHIRSNEPENDEQHPEVLDMLIDRLGRDENNRLFVDAFLLTHPDEDHVLGLTDHFHLGPLQDYKEDDEKIVIREMWSSPIIFRRKGRVNEKARLTLCDDAQNWATEARRRVRAFRDGQGDEDGNRVLILGDDIENKTEGLDAIRVETGNQFSRICGTEDSTFTIDLLGPLAKQPDEEKEDSLAKNRSSIISRFTISADGKEDACQFLTGGDAEVLVWDNIWDLYKETPEILSYDVMQTPHHCSLHSLSENSWSEMREEIVISEAARRALSQANASATIVASCKPITDEDMDPPCVRAEREYKAIADSVRGNFVCTTEHYGNGEPMPFTVNIGSGGPARSQAVVRNAPGSSPLVRVHPPAAEFEKPSGEGRTYG